MYITGTVTDANPGPALHAVMATTLTAAGYTLVDTVVIATRTHKIWKSPAAGNTQNLDWYLDVAFTTAGAAVFGITPFESFDPATDLGYRGVYLASQTTTDAATGTRFGATGFALETNWFSVASTGGASSWPAALTASTQFGYWCSINANRVILMVSGTPGYPQYAGFYEPDPLYAAKAGANIYPLVGGVLGGMSRSVGLANAAIARIAPQTLAAAGWDDTMEPETILHGSRPDLPAGSTSSYPFVASRIGLSSSTTALSRFGRWGWWYDSYQLASSTVVRGDTCIIDGNACVLSSPNNNSMSTAFRTI